MLHDGDAFFFGLVDKHLTLCGVAGAADGRKILLPVVADGKLAVLFHLDADFNEAKAAGKGVCLPMDTRTTSMFLEGFLAYYPARKT